MELNLDHLFTLAGAVTVDKRYQFAGREDLLKKVFDHLTIAGSAVVLFGERGVGKTSLAWQLFAGLSGNRALFEERKIPVKSSANRFRCVWLTCTDFIQTISDLALALLTDMDRHSLSVTFPEVFGNAKELNRINETYKWKLGNDAPSKAKADNPDEEKSLQPSNEELAAFLALGDLLKKANQQEPPGTEMIIFLDEFDQVRESTRVGVLMKALNNVKFVVIGVAQNRANLIGQHPSIVRKMNSYEVPLFKLDNIEWFFDSLERNGRGEIRFEKSFRALVADKSSGFPWLVQQFGYYSAARALAQRKKSGKPVSVNVEHYRAIINEFLSAKFGGDQFELNSLSDVARKILISLAGTPKGRMPESELIKSLDIALRPYFDKGLQDLERAELVYRAGKEVRIRDPLTKILINIAISEGKIA